MARVTEFTFTFGHTRSRCYQTAKAEVSVHMELDSCDDFDSFFAEVKANLIERVNDVTAEEIERLIAEKEASEPPRYGR